MQYNKLGDDDTSGHDYSKDPRHIQSKEINAGGGSVSIDGQAHLLSSDAAEAQKKKRIRYAIFGGIALILVILAIVLPLTLGRGGGGGGDDNGRHPLPPGQMNPYSSIGGTPAFDGSGASFKGYLIADLSKKAQLQKSLAMQAVPEQFKQFLAQYDDQNEKDTTKKVGVDWRNLNFFGDNNQLKGNLSYQFDILGQKSIARLVITTGNETRFSIPWNMVSQQGGDPSERLEEMGLKFFDPKKDQFGFKMIDVKDPNNVLLNTMGQTLLFSDKYIQMDYQLPSQFVYGLGDRVHEFRLNEGAFTMWSSGQDPSYDDGRGRGGLSGVHPFLMVQTSNPRTFIGLYFRNANAMTPVLRYNDDGKTSTLSFITIGGQLEVYIIGQGTAHSVIQRYQSLVGLPKLPPFWSLGWQEASPQMTETTAQASILKSAQNYLDKGYPLDAVYMPQNSWDDNNDFTLNKAQYPDPISIAKTLNEKNQRLVAYIDAAVKNNNNNAAYKAGKTASGFIKSGINAGNADGYLVNTKNGQQCVYVDWLNPQASTFWTNQVQGYQTYLNFDGLWTTQNEPFGESAGEVNGNKVEHLLESIKKGAEESAVIVKDGGEEESPYDQSWFFSFWPLKEISTYLLPFIPELMTKGNYDAQTLSLNATHINNVQDYDVHSLYPLGMANATVSGLQGDARPFYLTKGSFSGINKYTGAVAHTNNERTWDSLYYGLQSVLRSQMFGIPLSGADVCGFKSNGDDLDEELCLRWYQLATFFPLARHSQDSKGPRTEPFNFKNATYAAAIKKTMHDRMQYLRLLYTCLFQASDSGGSCIDPVQFMFTVPPAKWGGDLPDFTNSYIVAGSLLVSPIMNQTNGATTFKSYLPKANGAWVNMADWSEIVQGTDDMVTLQVRDTVNVHLAPGALIPFQNNTDYKVQTTADVLKKPISLVVNRDNNGQAGGSLFLDQGISQSEMSQGLYEYYNIQVQMNSVQVQPWRYNKNTQPHLLDQIVLVNAQDLNETNFACYFTPDSLEPQPIDTWFNTEKQSLHIIPRGDTKFSQILNIHFGSSNKNDLNLCDVHSFNYNIEGGVPNITAVKNVTMNLTHMAGTLDNITMYIGFHDSGIINVRWTWQNQTADKRIPFGVPLSIVDSTPVDSALIQDSLDKYITITDQPFTVTFNVKLGSLQQEPYLTIKGLLFDEYLNWLNVQAYAMPAQSEDKFRGVFGLGERASKNFFYKSGVYSLWAKDTDNPLEDGKLPGKENYGVHPFYMFKHANNSWAGVYHNNAQAQDWWIKNDFSSGKVSISTIATGGLGEIFIFTSAQKPESIVAKYHSLIGQPVLVPQWALGWNQCRWCYRNLQDVKTSMQGYIDNKIPLDTQWVDIDYMQDYKDFTYNAVDGYGNPGSFAGLPQFIQDLHNKNMRFVPIIDAGISYRPNEGYQAFDQGMTQDVFMKVNGQVFVGKVWPNEATYPDFTHPNAGAWWSSQLDSFQQTLAFDGLWQDMNEASNFCNGPCDGTQYVQSPIINKLRYTPTGESLETKAITLDVKHFNGMSQLDAHSLFGSLQVAASSAWFSKNNKRPLIISRSSFSGMGKYGSTWLGDNHSTLDDLEESVLSIMNMNIYGIPLTGADICGFLGDTTYELCTRWHAVGAFYPFSRNHKWCYGKDQEPWRFNDKQFDENHTYTDLMRAFIYRKYHLMRYYYTQMTQISLGNNTYYQVYKPLFFEFPDDVNAYEDIANNVMIGSAIKTSVNVKSLDAKTTDFYFPAGTWCSLFEPVGECIYNEIGQNVTLNSRLNESYAHLREGFIIPMQDATKLQAMTTVDLQKAPIDLHILGSFSVPGFMSWRAEGTYLNDDGLTTNLQGNVNQYRFTAQYSQSQGESLYITVGQVLTATNYFDAKTNCSAVNNADYLQSIYIYNASSFKQHDTFWVSVAYLDDIDTYETIGSATFDATTNRIVFDNSALGNLLCLTNVFRIAIRNLSPVIASVQSSSPAA